MYDINTTLLYLSLRLLYYFCLSPENVFENDISIEKILIFLIYYAFKKNQHILSIKFLLNRYHTYCLTSVFLKCIVYRNCSSISICLFLFLLFCSVLLGFFWEFFFAGGGSLDRKVDFSTSDILKHSHIKLTRASVAIKLAKA